MDAGALQTFAGTAKQASQRLVASEAACNPSWVYVAVDVEKAFLQGMTYEEMHQEVGEAPREVNFTLPLVRLPCLGRSQATRTSMRLRSASTASSQGRAARMRPEPSP